MSEQLTTALIYDFDGTLSEGNIQEHSFIPSLNINIEDFWREVKEISKANDADQILVYMHQMLKIAKEKGQNITKKMLREHGASAPLFKGTNDWFDRINKYSSTRNLHLEHYIISSGIHEMILGCPISKYFKNIYASKFIYEDGIAKWPGIGINYTTKTQYLFRINKGIENSWDDKRLNTFMPSDERPTPFTRMIFIGDGETDIPSMKMVRIQGGHSIAVFDPKKWEMSDTKKLVRRLISEDRVSFVAPADYLEDSQLDVTIKGILGKIARDDAGYRG